MLGGLIHVEIATGGGIPRSKLTGKCRFASSSAAVIVDAASCRRSETLARNAICRDGAIPPLLTRAALAYGFDRDGVTLVVLIHCPGKGKEQGSGLR